LEFFCGEGRVWKAVSAEAGSIGIDINYGNPEGGHTNAFDILTVSGIAWGPKCHFVRHNSYTSNHVEDIYTSAWHPSETVV